MPVVYSFSISKGLKKAHNQDAINVVKNKSGNILSVICDGVSSHKDSVYSSNYIVKELSSFWRNSVFEEYVIMKKKILDKILEIDVILNKKSEEKSQKLATTILLTAIFKDKLLVINVGDSLSYGVTVDKEIELLSVDDSFAGVLLAAGEITEEEARIHNKRNSLTQAVANRGKINIHIKEYDLNLYSYIINSTDGLTNMIEKNKIIDIVVNNDLTVAIETLIEEANNQGGTDNISVSVFKILEGGYYDK